MKHNYGIQETAAKGGKGLKTALLLCVLVLAGLAAMWTATEKAAFEYGFQPALGKPLFVTGGFAWYPPWAIFSWADALDPDVLDRAQTLGQIVFILPLLLGGALYAASRKQKGNATLHGSAHWATRAEIEALSYFSGKGVCDHRLEAFALFCIRC